MPRIEVEVRVQRLASGADLPLPQYATAQAAGLDLLAAVAQQVVLGPGQRQLIPTGIAIALPDGFEAQLRPRSGLALRHGLSIVNGPATVDADYRGEVGVLLVNMGDEPVTITRGDRIAQMIVAPVARARLAEVEALPESERAAGGWGSTGVATEA